LFSRSTFGLAALATALVLGSAPTASLAGVDGDGVPDALDNCPLTPNGPGNVSDQVDTDGDGYGNACDADYNGDGATTTIDYTELLTLLVNGEIALTGPDLEKDHDGDGYLTLGDLSYFEQAFTGLRNLGE